jgi:hypothetical protein
VPYIYIYTLRVKGSAPHDRGIVKKEEETVIKKEYQYETKVKKEKTQPHTGQNASRENVMTDIFFHFH